MYMGQRAKFSRTGKRLISSQYPGSVVPLAMFIKQTCRLSFAIVLSSLKEEVKYLAFPKDLESFLALTFREWPFRAGNFAALLLEEVGKSNQLLSIRFP